MGVDDAAAIERLPARESYDMHFAIPAPETTNVTLEIHDLMSEFSSVGPREQHGAGRKTKRYSLQESPEVLSAAREVGLVPDHSPAFYLFHRSAGWHVTAADCSHKHPTFLGDGFGRCRAESSLPKVCGGVVSEPCLTTRAMALPIRAGAGDQDRERARLKCSSLQEALLRASR